MTTLELFLIGFVLGASACALYRSAQLKRAFDASKKLASPGTVLHVGELYIDGFVTEDGHTGLTITAEHPDSDNDPRFLDLFLTLEDDGIKLSAV